MYSQTERERETQKEGNIIEHIAPKKTSKFLQFSVSLAKFLQFSVSLGKQKEVKKDEWQQQNPVSKDHEHAWNSY